MTFKMKILNLNKATLWEKVLAPNLNGAEPTDDAVLWFSLSDI
jgi:hypothetical protein